MSKVLVDRELLRDSSAELSDWRMSFPDADSGMTDRLVGEIDAVLAQPAEVEGVDFGFDDRSVKVSQEAYSIFLEREQHRLAALSAVTAERDQLRAEVEALRLDAERYRWIAGQPDAWHVIGDAYGLASEYEGAADLSEAIDAAMAAKGGV